MQSNEPDKEAFIKASAGVYEEFGKQIPGRRGADQADPVAALMAKLLGRLVALVEWWAVGLLAAMVVIVCLGGVLPLRPQLVARLV